ncbi:YncE family protein [Dyadobacter psychrotolerans]|nr:DUF5074 domain-containing protein [Dyadobacter psychrotolerans]
MKRKLSQAILAVSLSVFAWSCNQKDPDPKGNYIQGVFVMNEGNFQQNNGGVSFFKREGNTAEVEIFSAVNNSSLAGGVQGYAVTGDIGLILVDNDKPGLDKVQIVNSNTFETIATIGTPDIENPREVVILNSNKAYVSCWGENGSYTYKNGYMAVVDLKTNKVTKKISIGNGPDNLVLGNGKLFVGTTTFTTGKVLTAINTTTDEIVKTWTFAGTPVPFGMDADGKLWAKNGLDVVRINPDSYAIEATLKIAAPATKSADNFVFSLDRRAILFGLSSNYGASGETYKFAITDTQINIATPIIKRVFGGMAVDPQQGLIYAAVIPSYTQSGYAVRYRTDGSVMDSVKVGIQPTGFFFR